MADPTSHDGVVEADLHVGKTAPLRSDRGTTREGIAEPAETAEAASDEGESRLDRSLPNLLATGAVGGIDVSVGVIALVLITARTGNEVVASIGFATGFIALTMARSELITENFLVPVATVIDGRRPVRALLRLWGGTMVANLVGGGVVMVVFAVGWPGEIADSAIEIGRRTMDLGISVESFAQAVIAGMLITLMTWMQKGVSPNVGGRVIAALIIGFLVSYSHSNHVVVVSFEAMLGVLAGADTYGWGDVLASMPWWLFGNFVGGLGMVTVLRLVQARSDEG